MFVILHLEVSRMLMHNGADKNVTIEWKDRNQLAKEPLF